MTDHRDVIAAFVDNEPVGAEDLNAALAAADGREYLIDLLVLRGLVSDGLPGALKPGGTTGRAQPRSKSAFWLPVAAAALVAAALGAGFVAGRMLDRRAPSTPSDAPVIEASPATAPSAPAPTHVIRMEKGVDWNERSGGN